jgi:hypothetical protein
MSDFSVTPLNTDAQPPAELPAHDIVQGDGWWPAINITAGRQAVDLNNNVTAPRLRDAVRLAMTDIALELASWRADNAAGYAKLEDVPGRIMIDGQSDYRLRWFRAVCSVVAGDLGERLLGQGLTKAGADRAEALGAEVGFHQRNVVHAVRDFLGRPRIRARLV